jgi:hypothetical protein
VPSSVKRRRKTKKRFLLPPCVPCCTSRNNTADDTWDTCNSSSGERKSRTKRTFIFVRTFNELKNEKMKKYFLFGRSINNNDDDDDDDKIDRYKINASIARSIIL